MQGLWGVEGPLSEAFDRLTPMMTHSPSEAQDEGELGLAALRRVAINKIVSCLTRKPNKPQNG